ncbi:MAG: proline dehydrogenase family protein [Phycisphaeraceae bacterium]|nr:proline dehydrogenase family protein [Phycisphaeraceae bacterium]
MAFFKRQKSESHSTATLPSDPAEQLAFEIGRNLLETARRHPDAKGIKDKLADWAMRDQAFKIQLFRFVDTFPTLPDPASVHRHLVEYLSEPPAPGMDLPTAPPGMGIGLKAGGFMKGAMSKTIASQITAMGGKYIAGTDAASAIPHLRERWKQGVAFSVDLLGEACLGESEAAAYRERYADLITNLAEEVKSWPANDRLETDHLGPVPRANVSIKVSCLVAKFDPLDFDGSIQRCFESLAPLLLSAAEHNVLINFDVEQSELKDLNLALFMHCCEQIDFPAGLAMQAYLRSGDDDAQRVIDWANTLGRPITVRLVKGAYWDYEVIRAQEQGWPCPVWTTKRESDACFERMAKRFVEATPTEPGKGGVKLALGSHNLRSIAATMAALRQRGLPGSAVEMQMLYGMANGPKQAAIEQGLRLREYVPVGEMIPGMAYLVRRLLENTSNESWLMKGFDQQLDPAALLASPHAENQANAEEAAPVQHTACELLPGTAGVDEGRPYSNEPMRDFSESAVRSAFGQAIQATQVPHIENNSTVEQATAALAEAHRAFPGWRDTDPIKRANMMVKAADLMRQRRDALSGIIIKESGKPWHEADGDVCEAIDFCAYYARLAPSLFQAEQLGEFLGERNDLFYEPRGVAAVISPWNFPLAICAGMTVAALVTGNTALVKPAEQTPGIASVLCEILWEAGVPREVLHFLPGMGETVGAALVRDPRVSVIAFTGSKAVGLDIIQAAGVTPEEQIHVKRVVCEMGGKNAVIIDSSADLDEAVAGVVHSAFGFAGQKCSACSRVICLDDVHDRFVERFVEATRALTVGDPIKPGTDVGPVIDQDALNKIQHYIKLGQEEGRLELAMSPAGSEVWGKPLIGPHIFSGIEPGHRLAGEEVFGPVVAVMKAASFDEALTIANGTPYKLTGGLFSRTPSHLAKAREQLRVGNLYLNRGCTGALVGRQPFGGSGMSGVGSKAGGAQYLYQFVEPRCITENTMRRGFAPSLSD